MYSTSMFQSPPSEQFFVCDDHTSQLTQAYARTNETSTALTFSCSGALNAEVWACLMSQELPLFHKSAHGISIMAAFERMDTIIAVLGTLSNRGFISAEFAQKIVVHYPRPPAPTISLAAIEAEAPFGSLGDSNPGTDLCMDISYFTDEDETPEPDAKRFRFNS
jgi:hypothetical protein